MFQNGLPALESACSRSRWRSSTASRRLRVASSMYEPAGHSLSAIAGKHAPPPPAGDARVQRRPVLRWSSVQLAAAAHEAHVNIDRGHVLLLMKPLYTSHQNLLLGEGHIKAARPVTVEYERLCLNTKIVSDLCSVLGLYWDYCKAAQCVAWASSPQLGGF